MQLHQSVENNLVSGHVAQLGKWETDAHVQMHGLAADVCRGVLCVCVRGVGEGGGEGGGGLSETQTPASHTVHHCCVSTYIRLLVGVVHPEQSNCVAGLSICVTDGKPGSFHSGLAMAFKFTRRTT